MNLKELLSTMKSISQDLGIAEPYLVGGIPRDKVIGDIGEIHDLDLTNGDDSINLIVEKILEYLAPYNPKLQEFPDGHKSIKIGRLKLDFSSNFVVSGIEKIVGKELNPLAQEVYSRDFTCNSLLLSTDLKEIKDLTGKGLSDIQRKNLATILSPEITFLDAKRIARLFYLAAKLDFTPVQDIIDYLKSHPELLDKVSDSYLYEKIAKAIFYNKNMTLNLLKECGYDKLIKDFI